MFWMSGTKFSQVSQQLRQSPQESIWFDQSPTCLAQSVIVLLNHIQPRIPLRPLHPETKNVE